MEKGKAHPRAAAGVVGNSGTEGALCPKDKGKTKGKRKVPKGGCWTYGGDHYASACPKDKGTWKGKGLAKR